MNPKSIEERIGALREALRVREALRKTFSSSDLRYIIHVSAQMYDIVRSFGNRYIEFDDYSQYRRLTFEGVPVIVKSMNEDFEIVKVNSLSPFTEEVIEAIKRKRPEEPEGKAEVFLRRAADLIEERGRNYDDGKERSMAKAVGAFNGITGMDLKERDGWLFMQILKLVRLATAKGFHRDSYEDNIAYSALMAEAAAKVININTQEQK